ncbi:MAG: hypothetical protein WD425_13365 [Nitrospirales bacterium]
MKALFGLIGGAMLVGAYICIAIMTPYGIYHSFTKHSTGSAIFSLFIPPFAWYRAAEGVFWHDDFDNVNWELRLKNDTKVIASLLGASSQNIPSTEVQKFNIAIEAFAKELESYPTEKRNYLEQFGPLYIDYIESLLEDLMKNFEDALSRDVSLEFKESSKTLSLENRVLEYQGTEKFISELKLGLYALSEVENLRGNLQEKGKNQKNVPGSFKEAALKMLFLVSKSNLNKMENTYSDIFGKPPNLKNQSDKLLNSQVENDKPSPELLAALNEYQRTVGVLPVEFLAFTVEEQEAYIRGAMDAQYALAKQISDPKLEGYIGCLNQNLPQIISSAAQFTEKEGESNWLMPWSLTSLIGKTCPPEIRETIKEKGYIEAGSGEELYKLTNQLAKKKENGVEDGEAHYQKIADEIDKAFIRGVLDGQVFFGYGHRIPGFIDLLRCYNSPKTLGEIFFGYGADEVLAPSFGSRMKSVFFGVRMACESVIKKTKQGRPVGEGYF